MNTYVRSILGGDDSRVNTRLLKASPVRV